VHGCLKDFMVSTGMQDGRTGNIIRADPSKLMSAPKLLLYRRTGGNIGNMLPEVLL
jgi:hypothetical protein